MVPRDALFFYVQLSPDVLWSILIYVSFGSGAAVKFFGRSASLRAQAVG